jgi:NAD(P)-dependent dehydrogenase (short-subunit alcohol dehydrogenase family)
MEITDTQKRIQTLRPKNILIPGGGSGIGFATAKRLLQGNVNGIVLLGRNLERLDIAKAELSDERVKILQFDIKDVSAMDSKILYAQDLLGVNNKIDGLVSCSGVWFPEDNWRGFNLTEKQWDDVMNTNLKGTFFFMRKIVNQIIKSRVKGSVCLVSSAQAHREAFGPYSLSKAALSRQVQAFGKNLCEYGVVLNAVEPWVTKTDMCPCDGIADGVIPGKPLPSNSIKRAMRPEEIAEAIYVCLSEFGETLAGVCVPVGGGIKTMFSW